VSGVRTCAECGKLFKIENEGPEPMRRDGSFPRHVCAVCKAPKTTKCNLRGCTRTDEHEHGQSAYTAAGQTNEDFQKFVRATLDTAFDPGPGGYWAYLDEALEADDARGGTDNDLVALFRADGKSWVIAMPRGVYKKFAEAAETGKLDELLEENRYEPKTPEKK
jgi:hypothetical protein